MEEREEKGDMKIMRRKGVFLFNLLTLICACLLKTSS